PAVPPQESGWLLWPRRMRREVPRLRDVKPRACQWVLRRSRPLTLGPDSRKGCNVHGRRFSVGTENAVLEGNGRQLRRFFTPCTDPEWAPPSPHGRARVSPLDSTAHRPCCATEASGSRPPP